jgi:mRNA interferase RelE/StbE
MSAGDDPSGHAYRIEIKPSAAKVLIGLPAEARRRIGRRIDALARDPRPQGVEKLAGADDVYRVRAGDDRILHEIRDAVLLVTVVKVGHRRDAYR